MGSEALPRYAISLCDVSGIPDFGPPIQPIGRTRAIGYDGPDESNNPAMSYTIIYRHRVGMGPCRFARKPAMSHNIITVLAIAFFVLVVVGNIFLT